MPSDFDIFSPPTVDHARVDPVAREWVARGLGLGALVLVVREHEVVTAAVQVEALAQQIERHGRALDVPARPAAAPRRVPRRLARLGRLPEREVDRAALRLVDVDAGAGRLEQLLERAVRQRAVAGERLDVEVHALAVDHVGVARVDQLADEVEHPLDVLGGVRAVVGVADVRAGRSCVAVHVLELVRRPRARCVPRSAARAMILSSTSVTLLT